MWRTSRAATPSIRSPKPTSGAERAIRDLIARERPDDAILGEEFGETPGTNDYRWVLDPRGRHPRLHHRPP